MLDIKATKSSPGIIFNRGKNILSMTGESYPENSFQFFSPVFEWLNKEFRKLEKMELHVFIKYMNSSSTKCMLDILDILSDAAAGGCDIRVQWYYEKGNDRAKELAEEFKEDFNIPFDIIAAEDNSGVL